MAVREGATLSLDSVSFSFMTSEEVRKCSVLRITNPRLADNLNLPIPGGLYDPALGPLEENAPCKTCGQRLNDCPGHFGHIDLVFPVYNPLLFHFLHKLLQKTCLSCFHFTTHSSEVENFSTQLELIVKGDIAGAKTLEEFRSEKALEGKSGKASHLEDSDVSHASSSTIHSGPEYQGSENFGQKQWTSLQFAEVMSVIRNFLRLNSKKCKNCDRRNPKFTKPTFGLLRRSGLTDNATRSNLIRGCSVGGPLGGEMQGMTDVEDSAEHPASQEPAFTFFQQREMSKASELLPSEVKGYLECLWKNEARFCSYISDIQQLGFGKKKGGPSMFFLDTILVPPIKFRPQMKGGDSVMDHPQTVLLSKVLQSNISLGDAYINKEYSKIPTRMMDLQRSINILFDSKTAKGPGQGNLGSGICQLLEKKEGLFRQKMMGKRVNYACRSVISPDPYLGVNEIGIPPCFATKLTYPERVTPWNVAKLRNAVINGSEIHPGATYYVDKLSSNKLPPSRKMRISIARKLSSSRGAVSQLGKNSDYDYEGKIVHRHVRDGDVVLVNRQPTLHKPSIMAHVVRVLKGEKTLRMHYANCSTYNADFDGDEMNVHLPQDEVSRAEAYNIVNANNQYVRPSNGEPLRALIQDHIISSTLLTKRDTFLTLNEFNQLLYSSGVCNSQSTSFHAKPGQKVLFTCTEDMIDTLQPAILKPVKLWTGKQVITAVLNHITKGYPPFTVEKGGKLPGDFFKTRIKPGGEEKVSKTRYNKMEPGKKRVADEDKLKQDDLDKKEPEDKLLVYENELLRGMIDKAQFGEYGLVHTVQELYGSNTAGVLLSVFSRLFTAYLQMHGFTCGVDDLLIVESQDIERKVVLEACEKSGENIHCAFAGIKTEKDQAFDPFELQLNIEKTIRNDGDSALAYLDRQMTNDLNSRTSVKKITELLSVGLLKPSGKNCISLMTTSGAKGSKVNFQQISTFLGQQELEGKRVPRMVSGKTLPCFHPWDWAARAGGYISDRFLTGLRPQEYYFHCMAGREGLVDTAVKTSRSGYLQRCLIKNLEGLQIGYDHTVRDADGSIIQFLYGEDGVDVHQTSFITKFEALTKNQDVMQTKCDNQLGMFNAYISELPEALVNKADKYLDDISLMERISSNLVKPEDLHVIAKQKFLSSLAQPGEPVGVLAAQSVGEPSTQMTLNTFHLAGRGEMNVTLGIPRLQEIFMTASRDIETPIMTCPFKERINNEEANVYAMKLRKVTVADIIESIEVSVQPFAVQNGDICRIYKLKIKLRELPTFISAEDCKETLEVVFLRALEDAIQNHMVLLSKISGIRLLSAESEPHSSASSKGASSEVDEDVSGSKSHLEVNDDEDDDDDHDGGPLDASEDLGLEAHKRKLQATDEMDYEDGFGKEIDEGDSLTDENSEIDVEDNETVNENGEMDEEDNKTDDMLDNDTSVTPSRRNPLKPKSSKTKSESPEPKAKDKQRNPVEEKKRASKKLLKKDSDREIFSEASDSHFEFHFKFTNEPHLLLAEIAQRTAEIVYIQNPGKIERYRVTDCSENQVIYYGKDHKRRVEVEPRVKKEVCALHTSGVNFNAFWQMQDILDVRCIYSNNIHGMLETYGVEAARETIIREVNHVFSSYGISVSVRHLSLIADYMTHTGGYRPMSRLGGIAESTSPFSKMSFETASKFIVDAALYGEIDNLDAPSARICLGLPVKMGTGSFDLMQKMEI